VHDEEEEAESPNSWMKKVEMPSFEGNDSLGWITHAEKLFDLQQVAKSECLRLAFISMEGNVIFWFQYWKKKAQVRNWTTFKWHC